MEVFNSLSIRSLASGWSTQSFQNAIEKIIHGDYQIENNVLLRGGYIYRPEDVHRNDAVWMYQGGLKVLSPDEVKDYIDEGLLAMQAPNFECSNTLAALVLEVGYSEFFIEVARMQHNPEIDILDSEGRIVFSKPFISNEREGRALAVDIVTGSLDYLHSAGFIPIYNYSELLLTSSIASRYVIPNLAQTMIFEENFIDSVSVQ